MKPWGVVDAPADYLRRVLGPRAQLRAGVLMVYLGVAYFLWLPWSGEPPAIYTMSALALLFAGGGVVVSANTLMEVTSDVDDVEGELDEHETAGHGDDGGD